MTLRGATRPLLGRNVRPGRAGHRLPQILMISAAPLICRSAPYVGTRPSNGIHITERMEVITNYQSMPCLHLQETDQ